MHDDTAFEDVLKLVQQLSPAEKVRLIERVAPEIKRELIAGQSHPGISLLGIVKDLGAAPSAMEIDACRREAWATFPREDA